MNNAILVRDDFDSGTAPRSVRRVAAQAAAESIILECSAVDLSSDHLSLSKWFDSGQTTNSSLLLLHVHGHCAAHISAVSGGGSSGGTFLIEGSGGGGSRGGTVLIGGSGGIWGALVAHGGAGGNVGTYVGLADNVQQGGSYRASEDLWHSEPQNLVFLNACAHRGIWRMDELVDIAALDIAALSTAERNSSDIAATVEKISASLDAGAVDEESIDVAKLSIGQAIEYVRSNKLPGQPRVMMSDDGVLTLQWRNDTSGAALIFAGEGMVSVAIKNAEKSYSTSREDFPLDAVAPAEFVATVKAIVG